MDPTQEFNSVPSEKDEVVTGPRKLTWVELLYALLGIAFLYLVLGFIMAWVASWWEYERVLLYINGFMTQGMFLMIILFIMRTRKWSWSDFGWQNVQKRYLGSVLVLYILTWVVNILYATYLLERGFTPPDTDVYIKLLSNVNLVTFCLNLILAGILAPIIEETLFRGIIYRSLNTYMGKWTAAAISAAIFSGLHLQSYGFIPRFILGMVLAFLVMKYNSIKPSVALHALNNSVALLLAALAGGF
ncbi:CPBP family intramembrane glutamic endopeptidase [Desulfitobacterium dichloroeliminans]|uniref:CPBP family intramembrane glutamic endopeptidase n=1 Tax=Desulfitobacterium dichloroeliminans TaxID=233055 RepID=UPI000686A6E1|nr:type II CAAX endopeptidase family protein [Desulfitobacterium dichloroeliminans]